MNYSLETKIKIQFAQSHSETMYGGKIKIVALLTVKTVSCQMVWDDTGRREERERSAAHCVMPEENLGFILPDLYLTSRHSFHTFLQETYFSFTHQNERVTSFYLCD